MVSKKLFIKNLDSLTTEEHIEDLFSTYGDVSKINIKRGRRLGFVEMTSAAEAKRVLDNLDGSTLWGRSLKINAMNDSLRCRFVYLFSRFFE